MKTEQPILFPEPSTTHVQALVTTTRPTTEITVGPLASGVLRRPDPFWCPTVDPDRYATYRKVCMLQDQLRRFVRDLHDIEVVPDLNELPVGHRVIRMTDVPDAEEIVELWDTVSRSLLADFPTDVAERFTFRIALVPYVKPVPMELGSLNHPTLVDIRKRATRSASNL